MSDALDNESLLEAERPIPAPAAGVPLEQYDLEARILSAAIQGVRAGNLITPGFLAAIHRAVADDRDPRPGGYRLRPGEIELPRLGSNDRWITVRYPTVNPDDIEEQVWYACDKFASAEESIVAPSDERAIRAARAAGWLCARVLRTSPFETQSRFVSYVALQVGLSRLGYRPLEVGMGNRVIWSKLSWACTLREHRTIAPFADYLRPRLLPFEHA